MPEVVRDRAQAATRRQQKIKQRMTPPQTPTTQTIMTMYRPPSTSILFTQQEGLYFQLFQTQTASELSGYFDGVFWTQSVLREAHVQPAIKHAVVALGALYKTLEIGTESPPGSPSDHLTPLDHAQPHWEVAIQEYGSALQSLILLPKDRSSHRARLMSSVLLACFDSFIGDHKQAIYQIQSGVGLLAKLRAEQQNSFHPSPEEPVEEELVQMFTRLVMQAKSYDMAFHFPHPYVVRLTPQQQDYPVSPPSEVGSPSSIMPSPIPEKFCNVHEARLAWDKLCESVFLFTEAMFNQTHGDGPMGILPKYMRQCGIAFTNQIQAWSDAFEHILDARTAPGVSSQEKAGIAVIKMFQVMGQILFSMMFSETEMKFDAFESQFKTIVDLALEVVGDEERRAAAKRCPDPSMCYHRQLRAPDIFGGHEYAACHIKPSFSADLGIVPPLFVVATKCRFPTIRRQAIQLLRSSARRESMWDSELTARIGQWVTTIEEEEDKPSPSSFDRRPSSVNGSATNGSIDFADIPLGPGGNARWENRRDSSSVGLFGRNQKRTIPEEKRVMVRQVDFDLRARNATLQIGSRTLREGHTNQHSQTKFIKW
jgi:hypothetical protein